MPTATGHAGPDQPADGAWLPDLPTSEAIVTALYQALLGRDPERDGLRHHVNTLVAGATLADLMRSFVQSAEFGAKFTTGAAPDHHIRVDRDPPMAVELDHADGRIGALWAHIATTWAGLGDQDPYWSVLSDPQFRMPRMNDAAVLRGFYESGRGDVSRLEAWLHRNHLTLRADMVCAEYGCGVGRVTGWLAQRVNQVRAFDISATHLERARGWLAAESIHNVEFRQVALPEDLDLLAGSDLFFSQIVLQHNPPPIIALILDRAFRHLAPGGIAFFQVPTHRRNYAFSVQDYLAGLGGAGHIEMHCLPQQEIFRLAARHGMVPLEIEQDGMTGEVGTSHTFLLRKGRDSASRAAAPGRRGAKG